MANSPKPPAENQLSNQEVDGEIDDESLEGVVGGMQVQTSGRPAGSRGFGGSKQPQSTTPVFETGATLDGLRKQV